METSKRNCKSSQFLWLARRNLNLLETHTTYFTFLGMGQAKISTSWPVLVGQNSVYLYVVARFQVDFLTLPIPRDTMSISVRLTEAFS